MLKFLKNNIVVSTILAIYGALLPLHRKRALVVIVLTLLGGVLDVLGLGAVLPVSGLVLDPSIIHTNQYVSAVYKTIGFSSEKQFLSVILVCLFLIFVVKNLTSLLINYYQSRFSFGVSTELSDRQFNYYLQKDLQFFNQHNSSLLARYTQVIPGFFATFLLLPSITFVSEFFVIIVIVSSMAIYNFTVFSLLTVSLGPVFILIYRYTKNKIQKFERDRNKLAIAASKEVYQAIYGYTDVKLFNKEHFFIRRFVDNQKKLNQINTLNNTLNLLPSKIVETTALVGIIIMLMYSIFADGSRQSTLTMLTLYVAAAYRLMPSINKMLVATMSMKGYQYAAEIIREASFGKNSFEPVAEDKKTLNFQSEIAFKNVSFRYDDSDQHSLKNVNISIKRGQRVGFVGKSGSGKTTLINILLRFLKEKSGQICVDGVPLQEDNETAWRSLIGYVKQNVFILDGDFYDNIAFGELREKVDIDRFKKAIRMANLEEVINKLPKGADTNIGENGMKLSGGQRQRIAIARALYRNAQILIFDEATSALDNETEKEITDAIDSLSGENKTLIIIAHRFTTLKNCEVIYEMKEGEVMAEYDYKELMKQVIV